MMILFDPDQPEAAGGFQQLAIAADKSRRLPAKPTLRRYLREAQAAVELRGEVAVLLTTDAGIAGLNWRYAKKKKATDVLSFPVDDVSFGQAGDLVISVETAARQAREQGHSLRVELRVLMLHGLLHLAGYDHETDDGEMAAREQRMREKLGLPLGLIERVNGGDQGTGNREQGTGVRDQGSGVRGQGTGNRDQKSQSGFPSGMTNKSRSRFPSGMTNKSQSRFPSGMTDKKAKAKARVGFGTAADAKTRGSL